MNAAEFVSRLGAKGKPRKTLSGWQCCCPAHDDKTPSLSVADGDNGGVVVKCWAGCTADAVCAAVGLTVKDLMPSRPTITSALSAKPVAAPRESFDWSACVAAFTDAKVQKLATWRDLSIEFVRWLHAQGIVGIFEGKTAFANHSDNGKVVSCHVRLPNGKWIFEPQGQKTAPLVFGNPKTAGFVMVFESQFDAFAVMDKLGWHTASGLPDTAVFITRGAANGKLIRGQIAPDAFCYAFKQNDEPTPKKPIPAADVWLADIASNAGCKVLNVATPALHKDCNDWTRAGATKVDLDAAIAAAKLVQPPDAAPIWTPQAAQSENGSSPASDPLPGNENELTEADAATIENNRILDMLAKRRFDYSNPPPPVEPRFSINDIPVSTAGNITTVSAQAKDGKTATLTAAMAATMTVERGSDNLGWTSSNPSGFAVLHFDTEQSIEDHYAVGKRTTDRAGRADAPSWFLSYCLTGFTVRESRAAITLALAAAATQCGGIHSVFLDGSADFVCDVNDPAESNEFVASMHALAIEYHCPILAAIHLNPGSDFKTRGHLGSQLERKAESNLKLERDGDIIILFATRNRKAPITKDHGPRFQWSNEHHRHVSIETVGDAKADARRVELREEADAVFEHAKKKQMSWAEIMDAIQSTLKVKEGTARKRFDAMRHHKIITRNIIKKYELEP